MASEALYEALAQALSRPSKAYRATQAALDVPQEALKGYLEGGQVADVLRKRKLGESTLSQALGGNVPEGLSGFGNLSVNAAGELSKPIAAMAELAKANASKVKPSDFVTQDQATKALMGIKGGKVSPEDQAFLSSFPQGQIPRQDFSQYVSGQTARETAGARNDFFGTKAGQIRLDQLPSNMSPSTLPGAAAQVKIAARQGKALIAKATSPQSLSLASSDLSRAVQRSAPLSTTLGEADYSNTLPTLFGRLKQKLDSDPSSPDVPKLRKQLYDTFDELDKSATPFIENHLNNYEQTIGALPNNIRQRELGNTLPDIPFVDTSGAPSSKPKTLQQNGFTYVLNNQTGRYE